MSRLRTLNDVILPQIAASGCLGDNVHFVECFLEDKVKGEAQFASTVVFVVAVFQSDEGTFQQPLVVKYNMGNADVRKWLKLDYQFRNEVITYEKVLPFLNRDKKVNKIFPKYIYGSANESEDPNEYIIILEDLRSTAYKLSPEFLDLDFDHCAMAFKKLGEFHALSFVAKQLNPKAFYQNVNQLIETRLFDDNKEDANDLYVLSFNRASEELLKNGEFIDEIVGFKNKLKCDSQSYLKHLVTAEEPMAVICHGDFCRNNILYKYDQSGTPVDVKFFDLATSRYSSPMIDFSFFFFLNSSQESRKQNREKYLSIYYEALSSAVPAEVKVPSFEDFKEEFLRKAVYGFMISIFFKPAMMDPVPFNPEIEVSLPRETRAAKLVQNGGQKGTEVIVNMLREILELKLVL
ncbi:uncharacterized protein LOC128987836 [Macrosteles quadrilineatus]|uniref:uncharacterized protein LOC128987836 n=1 Tax=Macrosteles quadrilineatus TaxID=74068 RepID=UPI0023E24A6B|nr:uncharacterized protein LOC128987836 [Macrosteles quadrilineatus]